MLYNTLIAALAIGAPVFAAPTADFASDASNVVNAVEGLTKSFFSIPQVATGAKIFKNGPGAYQKAYQKYKAPVPAHVASAAAAVQSGSVTATPESYDEAYLCPVTIGTSGQTLNLDFDTGSADLWVFSNLQSSSSRSGHTIYTPSSSSTSKKLSGYTWNISYGDGSGAKGVVYSDKVVVGPVTATSQAVEAATSVSSTFAADTNNDGLLGLAFSSINTVSPQAQTTFFDTVKSTLAKPLFAAYLKAGKAGTYDFGYIDSSKYTGSFTTVSVDSSNGFWEFTAGTAYAGSSSVGSIGDAIADTGTTLILVSDSVVSSYYSHVSGAQNSNAAGGWIFPCSATLPTFSITINGAKRTVPGSYINYAPNGDGTCYGGIQSSAGIGFNILGDVFLKSQYVVFNSQGPSLQFAQSV